MKTPAVKGLFAAVAAVVLAATPLTGRSVTVDVTKFQQRYPWNGLVDIDYTISRSGNEAELDAVKHSVRIFVVNCENATTNVAHVFRQGALPVSDGAHRVTWDANAEGINFKSQDVKVFAEIIHYAEKYMVIDVSAGPEDGKVYPVTYLHGEPAGGLNTDEYKGSKIVLRLIPPGAFVMGSPTGEPGRAPAPEVQHAVAISKPFYIGVFEVTQGQYEKVTGSNPSAYKDDGRRPVENVKYNDIRGTADVTTHQNDWPWTNEVAADSFMGRLRAKCREWDPDTQTYAKEIDGLFDLPTEAQWEYACRAGTATPYNNGEPCAVETDLGKNLQLLGRYKTNSSGLYHAVVGTAGASNDWGLYDMHGNVWEWCLDWYREDVQNIGNPSLDPVGPNTGTGSTWYRIRRGGSWADAAKDCRSACRAPDTPVDEYNGNGFRLCRTLP